MQLRNRFAELRDQKYNPNSKGYDYEEIVKEFFEDYMGGAFDLLIRVGVLDNELKVRSVLRLDENEFDVVGIFKDAIPKLVHHRMIPYDSVAFITEVKQTLKSPDLEEDLEKFSKLDKLHVNPRRIHNYIEELKHPLRILFYYDCEADRQRMEELLGSKYAKSWDLCVVVTDNLLYLNSTLPIVNSLQPNIPFKIDSNYVLTKTMYYVSAYYRWRYVNGWKLFYNLFRSSVTR
jgi:hypothetical protein